jgi:pantetheine-phosphate adenylyltransferase
LGLLKAITGLEAVAVEGLLADYVRSHKISALIRSLRSAEDFHREMTMAEANRRLCGVETVLLMPAPQYAAISSSLVREIARLGGDVSAFVPEEVVKALENM